MTDIASLAQLQQALSPLHARAYFDEALFVREQEILFRRSALYVGHEKSVPEPGDWRRLPQDDGSRILVRNGNEVALLSNVCRHRQAVMLGPIAGGEAMKGNLSVTGGNIVCPLHRWTYDGQGRILGAPHFPTTPCLNLSRFPLHNCHGLLFEGPRDPLKDLDVLFCRREFDFSDYVLDHVEVHRCNYNWKTFIEVYLEDYHVGPFHPGLGRFVTCADLSWEFGAQYSLQKVGVHDSLEQPGTEVYRGWHDNLMRYRGGKTPDFGAIWVTYFPTHMIELYPHVLVLSTLYPKGPQETLNIAEFYYPEEIALFERDFVQAQRAAYMETAVEDDEIGERMDAGRLALLRRGVSDSGPYQSPMEDGMLHFHEWYLNNMREQLGDSAAPHVASTQRPKPFRS